MNKNKPIGFICGTDELDLGLGATDIIIYPTIEALKARRSCHDECGIQAVYLGEYVQEPMSLNDIIKKNKNEKAIK